MADGDEETMMSNKELLFIVGTLTVLTLFAIVVTQTGIVGPG